ncbi:MAG: hypothetical protein P4L22_02215, partial [Candidatus Babeliales bacterium]|nr:hypothetical protein [Candidatus Babeliales bacterium]
TLMKMGSPSNYISWSGNSKLLSVSETGKIIFWCLKTGNHLAFKGDIINYDTVSFCPNSLQFSYISGRSLNNVYFLEKQIKSVNLLQHNCKLNAIAYSHDGTKLAICDINGSVFFIDADSQEDVGMGYNHEGIESLHWSKDGNKLVSQSPNCLKVWDCNNNATLSELVLTDEEKVSSVALSPDGNLVAYSCLDCVRIWDIKNNQLLNDKLTGFTQGITCIAWAPDSKRLAAGSLDKTIKIWGKTLA